MSNYLSSLQSYFSAKSEATSEASQVVSVKGREEEIKKLQLLEGN